MDDINAIYQNSNLLISKYLKQLDNITNEHFWDNLNKDIQALIRFYKEKNINIADMCITINDFFEIILRSKQVSTQQTH